MVSLVDDKDCGKFFLMPSNNEAAQRQQKLTLTLARYWKSEVAGNILQELQRREPAVENVGIPNIAASKKLEKTTDQ